MERISASILWLLAFQSIRQFITIALIYEPIKYRANHLGPFRFIEETGSDEPG